MFLTWTKINAGAYRIFPLLSVLTQTQDIDIFRDEEEKKLTAAPVRIATLPEGMMFQILNQPP